MGVLAAWRVARVLVRRWSSVPEWTPCTRWVWALPAPRFNKGRSRYVVLNISSILVSSSSALFHVM